MSKLLTDQVMGAFKDELEKDAGLRELGQQAVGALSRRMPEQGWLGRFARRQYHGLTGWLPEGQNVRQFQQAVKGRSWESGQAVEKAMQDVAHRTVTSAGSAAEYTKALKKLDQARKFHQHSLEAERLGMTNLPGTVTALASHPVRAVRAGLGAEWHSGPMGKAMLSLPVAGAAYGALKKPQEGGPGRLESAGRSLGDLALMATPLPVIPSMLAGGGASAAFRGAGRLADRGIARLKRRPPPVVAGAHPADEPGTTGAERMVSPTALDRPGGGIQL
jgi:hypothetical protein